MDALKKWMFFQKHLLKSSLLLSMSPNQQRRPLPSLLCLSFFYDQEAGCQVVHPPWLLHLQPRLRPHLYHHQGTEHTCTRSMRWLIGSAPNWRFRVRIRDLRDGEEGGRLRTKARARTSKERKRHKYSTRLELRWCKQWWLR